MFLIDLNKEKRQDLVGKFLVDKYTLMESEIGKVTPSGRVYVLNGDSLMHIAIGDEYRYILKDSKYHKDLLVKKRQKEKFEKLSKRVIEKFNKLTMHYIKNLSKEEILDIGKHIDSLSKYEMLGNK
jgi:hypothetical protein